MRKTNKFVLSSMIILTIVSYCILSSFTYTYVAKTIIGVPLYSEAGYESEHVLDEIKANEIVELLESEFKNADGVVWQKVRYNEDYEGYIPYGYIYFTTNNSGYTVQVVKAKSTKIGEKIEAYNYYSEGSKVVKTFSDGEKINLVVENNKDYAGYSKIVIVNNGQSEFCFVKDSNITVGLSYNQTLALIISAALIVLLMIGTVILLVLKKRKKQ